MTQYNKVKLSASQLNKLKLATKNPKKRDYKILLLIMKLILIISYCTSRESFACKSLADIKFSEAQLSKVIKSRIFLDKLLEPLIKLGFP